ncbi:uncharacterized protein UTRI_05440 [Ustilago trichophora]|uniref:Uncharacterized protein n=1 Tax=Ustilago trichophora TaxID=86804 RepID=A0A5C3EGG6_9BASI|nr:uncharacterized protein UTRI_05440 [Ustilago trichophora]
MRIELLLLFCLACLVFTAQAAPASEKDALLEQKLKQRKGEGEGKQHKPNKPHHSQRHHHRKHHGLNQLDHASSAKHTRAAPMFNTGAARAAEEAGKRLLPQEHLLSELRGEITAAENDHRQLLKSKKHEMQVEDSLHIATTGKLPPKFPTITRIGSALGLTSAVLNVINIMFAAKTTALATTQFAPPPIPPTLLDTAARWDGNQYTLLPPPSDGKGGFIDLRRRSLIDNTEPKNGAHHNLKKRSLASLTSPSSRAHGRMIKRRKPLTSEEPHSNAEEGDSRKLAKRWVVSAVVGAALGAALAPGFPSMVTGKWKAEVDKPRFDPYNPDILKQNDPFSAAAATPDQPLPMPPLRAPPPRFPLNAPPNLGHIVFPTYANSMQQQPPLDAYSRQNSASGPGYTYGGESSAESTPADTQAVLRKRAVESDAQTDGKHEKATSSSHLDKRFLFSGGPGAKLAGAVTVGSVVPLLYGGVTHARWRTENPRDRDILKDLDDTPTYGAVGVPGHVPGQLATNAMPGYADYIARLQAHQAQQQAAAQATAQRQYLATQAMQLREYQQNRLAQTTTAYTESGGSSEPVLRKRDTVCSQTSHGTECYNNGQTRLDKRGNWLMTGGLALAGLALGYFQSATQFPTDRDEEKDAKKREMKKQQKAEMQAAQQQQEAQGGGGGGGGGGGAGAATGSDPFAGMQISGTPLGSGGGDTSTYAPSYSSSGSGSALAYDGGAGLSGAGAGAGGYASTQKYDATGASGYDSSSSGYGSSATTYSSGNTGASAYGSSSAYGSDSSSAGGSSSLAASLNAAAGYSNSAGGGASSGMLKKRDTSDASEPRANDKARPSSHEQNAPSLSKRTPGFANALTIGGTTLFVGTLLGNLFVSSKQKSKPVPLVTPNADTRGPMVIGGDMYTAYLESKRAGQMAGPGQGGVGGSGLGLATGSPASINDGAAAPAYSPSYGGSSYGGSSYGGGSSSLADTNTYSTASNAATTGNSYPQQDTSGAGGSAAVLKKRSVIKKPSLSADADALRKRSPLGMAAIADAGAAASLLGKAPAMVEAGAGAASLISKAPAMTELGAGAVSKLGAASRLSGLSEYGSSAAGLARGGAFASEAGLGSLGRSSMAAENTYARMFRPGQAGWGSANPATVSSFRGAGGTGGAGVPATLEDLSGSLGRSASSRTGYQGFSQQQIMEAEQRAAMASEKGLAGQGGAGAIPEPKKKGMTGMKAIGIVGAGSGASMMFNGIG